MSATYILYLEAKINDKWRCINGYYRDFEDKDDDELRLQHLLLNGSRTYFSNTFDKLCEIGYEIPFTELSEEVQNDQPNLKYNAYFESDKKELANYLTIPVDAFKRTVPKGFQYHGVFHKDKIAAYDNDEIDELYQEEVDLSKLTELERKCYEYKEWDSPYDWQWWFKKLDKKIDFVSRQYRSDTWAWKDYEMRIVAFCL